MYRILQVLTDAEIAQCRGIAAEATFVDGKISNPRSTAKKNEQLHEPAAYKQSAELLKQALTRSPEFIDFAFPVAMAAPMMARYKPGMEYGAHADSAFIPLPGATIRSDISCTVFLNDPADYDGGELHVRSGDADLTFKLKAGEAILYPSDSLAPGLAGDPRRAAGRDHLHPEPDPGPVPAQSSVRVARSRSGSKARKWTRTITPGCS